MGNFRTVTTLQSIQSSDSGFARRGPQPITKNRWFLANLPWFEPDVGVMLKKKSFRKSLVSGPTWGSQSAQILNPFNYRALQSYQKLPGSMANHVFLFFLVLQEAFEEIHPNKHAFHD